MGLLPKVIFLDAVGTLFGVNGGVGDIYAACAQRHYVEADAKHLNQAFLKVFKAAPPMAFPNSEPTQVPAQEYALWRAIVQQTFSELGLLQEFADFDAFFEELYAYFATSAPWFVYPDVIDALKRWRRRGIELGVISNFDSRLYTVLEALNLGVFFQSVTISSEVGAAKPNDLIFATALQKHGCLAAAAWHVGDSYQEDYRGSMASGLKGIWLNRSSSKRA